MEEAQSVLLWRERERITQERKPPPARRGMLWREVYITATSARLLSSALRQRYHYVT